MSARTSRFFDLQRWPTLLLRPFFLNNEISKNTTGVKIRNHRSDDVIVVGLTMLCAVHSFFLYFIAILLYLVDIMLYPSHIHTRTAYSDLYRNDYMGETLRDDVQWFKNKNNWQKSLFLKNQFRTIYYNIILYIK